MPHATKLRKVSSLVPINLKNKFYHWHQKQLQDMSQNNKHSVDDYDVYETKILIWVENFRL